MVTNFDVSNVSICSDYRVFDIFRVVGKILQVE